MEPSAFEAAPVPPAPDASVAISDLWLILSHRRGTIVATALLFGLIALLYGVLTPPLYTASVQILIDPRDRQVVTNDLNASGVAPDGGVTQAESQVKVLQSNAVLLRAIRATGLLDDPEFEPKDDGLLGALKRAVMQGSPAVGEEERDAEALATLRRRLAVKRADKVCVVDAVVTTRDADKSARIADAAAYLAEGASARAQAAKRAAGELGAPRRAQERPRRGREGPERVRGRQRPDRVGRAPRQRPAAQRHQRPSRGGPGPHGRGAEPPAAVPGREGRRGDRGTSQEALNSVVIERLIPAVKCFDRWPARMHADARAA